MSTAKIIENPQPPLADAIGSQPLSQMLAPTLVVLECALDYTLGRTRVSFSGKHWGSEQVQAEITRLKAMIANTKVSE